MESTKIDLTSDAPCRQSIEALSSSLKTDPVTGLAAIEAAKRLASDGPNELEQLPPTPLWKTFMAQFANALVILLLVAISISTALWLYEGKTFLPYEALAILAVVLANATLGCVQQARAESAVAALQKMSATHCTVIRDGETKTVEAKEIVAGDLLALEEGETIPADARMVESISLRTAEAALTGESSPVTKNVETLTQDAGIGDRHNMVFSGTSVVGGRGRAIATATGMRTEMGRIASLLQKTPVEPTPLEKELDRLGKVIGGIVVVIAFSMIATIVTTERVQGFTALFDVFVLGVALAVAAVPEGLPAMVTMVLALGVRRMAARKAVVRHLSAVETFGSATVIATDKTGTLTRNEMTVRTLATATGRVEFKGVGYEPVVGAFSMSGDSRPTGTVSDEARWALTVADRANNARVVEKDGRWEAQGDPTEAALLVAARKAGLESSRLDARFHRMGEIPFESERRLMTTIQADSQDDHRHLAFTKGAPDAVLARCTRELVGDERRPLDDERRRQILATNDELAGQALRVIGLAFLESPLDAMEHKEEDLEHDLVFAGLIGMIDPPREESKQSVALAKTAGIRPIMITGDHPATAKVIATELGIGENGLVATGAELSTKNDQEFAKTVQKVSIFARVDPSQKLRIVKALQGAGETVAMTGDGVNDAPALKAADIGVAMGISGTDVSREAADVVLADDNYATIVSAVEEGRAIFDNIRKFLRYLLSSNIGEVLTMFFGVVFAKTIGLHFEEKTVVLPLLATHILWVNLATDGAPALALGLDRAEPGNMQLPPRIRGERAVTPRMWTGIVISGTVIAAGTLLVLDASLPGGMIEGTGTLRHAQSMAFTTLVLFQLFNCFNARSDVRSAFHGLFHNAWLWAAIGLSLLLQVAVLYVPFLQTAFSTSPLGPRQWL
ncbi:MAG: cation-translocating P-type ATPase, partial [Fibrobacterota bacterium]